MYNYLILLFVFILVILLLTFMNYNRNYVKIPDSEYYSNNIENFTPELLVDYNLISNNCFENKKNLSNFINQNGQCQIVNYQNPGKSPFVLNQKYKSFYEISTENSVNSSYLLYFYIHLENLKINEFNFDNFIKIRMPTKDYSNLIPKIKYNVEKKIDIGKNKEWYYIKVLYNSNENVLDKQIITFNNEKHNCELFITDISLFKVLNNAPNFIFNKNLICFIDAIDYNSNNNILHDISGNNNDLYLSNIPKKNDDYIELTNAKIEGFPSKALNSEKFTILFTLNKLEDNNDQKQYNKKDKVLLSIQGNNNYVFEIAIIDDYLYLFQENKKIKSNKPLNYFNKSVITILYDGKVLNIFNENMNILSHNINKIYMNNKPIIINKNQNLNLNLHNIVVYNRIVETKELKNIREYFITNQNKNTENNPNTLNLTFDNIYDSKNLNNPLINGFDNNIEKFESPSEETYEEIYDNSDFNMKYNCVKDCNNICNKFLDGSENQIDNYKNCLKNCKNVMNSCKEYCNDNEIDNTYCDDNNENKDKDLNCPKVYKKNGKYVVYIPEKGIYSWFFTGEKIFSSDIDKARNMYAYNFPDCPIPKELIQDNNKYKEYCPFTISELNPCNSRVCSDVNWNVKNYKDLKASDKCKKVISNYCHINYDKDENCICWSPKYKNTPECIEYRKFFEDPNDYCCISSFNIEDHPDIKKYIKKDKIPCWGCNIPE